MYNLWPEKNTYSSNFS
jgi:hypothetical protein